MVGGLNARRRASLRRLSLATTAFIAVSTLAGAGRAQTWTGTTSNDWFTAGNWLEVSVPLDGDTVSVTNGSILLTNTTAYLDSLTITNATIVFTNFATALQSTNITLQNNGKFQHVVRPIAHWPRPERGAKGI